MAVLVTGCAGFIGSSFIKLLNEKNIDVIGAEAFDLKPDLSNLFDLKLLDLIDIHEIESTDWFDAIFHFGAVSSTTETDTLKLHDFNFSFSKSLYDFAKHGAIPFLYASSASVYGRCSEEEDRKEIPLNHYGFSKRLFDDYINKEKKPHHFVAGLRFFNVYGAREGHKGSQASPVYRYLKTLLNKEFIKMYQGPDGYGSNCITHKRDFIHVDDVCSAVWEIYCQRSSGIHDIGTGVSHTFLEVSAACCEAYMKFFEMSEPTPIIEEDKEIGISQLHYFPGFKYVPFPDELKGRCQPFTQANKSIVPCRTLEQGAYDVLCELVNK